MKLRVLALDYDGTIAADDVLDASVHAAIGDARGKGLAVVLVTSRILSDLHRTGLELQLLDAVVAENGAVMSMPKSGRSALLAHTRPSGVVV